MKIIDLIALFINYGEVNAFDEVTIGKNDRGIDTIEIDEDDSERWVRILLTDKNKKLTKVIEENLNRALDYIDDLRTEDKLPDDDYSNLFEIVNGIMQDFTKVSANNKFMEDEEEE